jgi:hypothetical protein
MPFRWSGRGQEERMRFDGVVKSFYETDAGARRFSLNRFNVMSSKPA